MNTLAIEKELADRYKYRPLSKELSHKYRDIYKENIPDFLNINGDDITLYSKDGLEICNGYNRIVIGDYGAFIEFSKEQAIINNYKIKEKQEYRICDPKYSSNVKYFWLTANDCSDIKIYYQKRPVTYADYKPNMYYVSPHEVFNKMIISIN